MHRSNVLMVAVFFPFLFLSTHASHAERYLQTLPHSPVEKIVSCGSNDTKH